VLERQELHCAQYLRRIDKSLIPRATPQPSAASVRTKLVFLPGQLRPAQVSHFTW